MHSVCVTVLPLLASHTGHLGRPQVVASSTQQMHSVCVTVLPLLASHTGHLGRPQVVASSVNSRIECVFLYFEAEKARSMTVKLTSAAALGHPVQQICPTYCNTLQHTVTHYNTPLNTTAHCSTLQHTIIHRYDTATNCNKLQHTTTQCNTLQHNAAHCNTLQHTVTHCNTLQHTVTHGNTLQ